MITKRVEVKESGLRAVWGAAGAEKVFRGEKDLAWVWAAVVEKQIVDDECLRLFRNGP